jgi:hypothetical protein
VSAEALAEAAREPVPVFVAHCVAEPVAEPLVLAVAHCVAEPEEVLLVLAVAHCVVEPVEDPLALPVRDPHELPLEESVDAGFALREVESVVEGVAVELGVAEAEALEGSEDVLDGEAP